MYTLINGSPKPINSNSLNFLKKISKNIQHDKIFDLKTKKYEELIENIYKSNIIVLSFPLYADSPPSITLEFLDYIIDNKINLKNHILYVIINCGFKEAEQNITALNIIKNWCNKVELIYGGSLLIGAGEITGKEKFKTISKKVNKQIKDFSNIIKEKQINKEFLTTIDILNNKAYCFIANIFWTKNGKENKLSKKDIKAK